MRVLSRKEQSVEVRAQEIREEVNRFASMRLARGNLRLQLGLFASASEWKKRAQEHPDRIKRLNNKLGV